MAEISCKHCDSPDCRGCNIYRLEQMLNAGKLDTLMNENRMVQISADVRPVVRGRWDNVSRISRKGFEWFKCSNCGMEWSNLTNYCPNCGAKMEVQDE